MRFHAFGSIRSRLAGLAAVLVTLAGSAFPSQAAFTTDNVDHNNGAAPNRVSLVTKYVGGTNYLAYERSANNWVRYATKTSGGSWSIDSSLTGASAARDLSLAVNTSTEVPHLGIICDSPDSAWVRYATKSGGSWTIETVLAKTFGDNVDNIGGISIALNGSTPNIAYAVHRNDSTIVYLSTRTGSNTWTPARVVAYAATTIEEIGLVYVSSTPTMAYSVVVGSYWNLVWGKKGSSTWSFETVDSTGGVYFGYANPNDVPQLAYYHNPEAQLYYAYRDNPNSTWIKTSLRPAIETPIGMTVDGSNNPYIVYTNDDSVRLASHANNHWNYQRVAEACDADASIGVVSGATKKAEIVFQGGGCYTQIDHATGNVSCCANEEFPMELADEVGVDLAIRAPAPGRIGSGGVAEFTLTLPREETVELSLHDIAGRALARRASETLDAGVQRIHWAVGSLAPGVYLVRAKLAGGAHVATTWVVLR